MFNIKKAFLYIIFFIIVISCFYCGIKRIRQKPVPSACCSNDIIFGVRNTLELPTIDEDKALEYKCKSIYNRQKGEYLVLVNKDNPLSEDYFPELKPLINSKIKLEVTAYNALTELLRDAKNENHRFLIASGYRSRKKQQALVNEDVKMYMYNGMTKSEALEATYAYTMPAGCSEHETGLAIDILDTKNTRMDDSQGDQEANIWLQENCFKYGFILRYPKDKENITGIKYEPWHIRYVGTEVAKLIFENGLTFEEFIAYVQK